MTNYLVVGVVLIIVLFNATGDYFLKIGSNQSNPYIALQTLTGVALYATSAFGWIYVMQRVNLTVVGIIYSSSTIIILTLMSLYIFKEDVSAKQLLAVSFALIAVLLSVE
jgi:drug/metabolite transporter (DMT)-like permease